MRTQVAIIGAGFAGLSAARKLRQIAPMPLFDINPAGAEFTVLVARRMADGEVVVLGEVDNDAGLLDRAAKRLLG